MNKKRSIVEEVNSLQNAGKVLSITLNIQESFYNQGKLGKAFFHLSTRKGFRSSRKGFVNLFPNLGKLLKILGKVSFQNFPKLPWERKGKGKLSVLPVNSTGGYTAQKKRIELETENWWTEVFFGVVLVSKLSLLKVIWLNLTLFGTGFERMKKCPSLAQPSL